jgi:hypothetical protein
LKLLVSLTKLGALEHLLNLKLHVGLCLETERLDFDFREVTLAVLDKFDQLLGLYFASCG